jgi:hypothetical protein
LRDRLGASKPHCCAPRCSSGGRFWKIGHKSRLQKIETEWALAGRVKNGRSSHAAIALALEASNSSADHTADAGHPFGSFDGGAALIGTCAHNIGLVLFCQSFQPDNVVSRRVVRVKVAHQLSGLLPPPKVVCCESGIEISTDCTSWIPRGSRPHMPTLHWLTRDEDICAANTVPYRLLEEVLGPLIVGVFFAKVG